MQNEVKLTKEQYEQLKPYEKLILAAYRQSFVRVSAEEFSHLVKSYEEIFGVVMTQGQRSCNTCRLNALRKLGAAYDNYLKTPKRPRKQKLENGEK